MARGRPIKYYRWYAPAKRLLLISLLVDIGATCMLFGVQERAIALRAQPVMLGLLGMAAFLLYVPSALVAGPLSDRFGRRRVSSLALLALTLCWLGMWGATNVYQLLALSLLSGVGLATVWAPVEAWLGDLSGGSVRLLNRNLGLFNVAWTAGLTVGPLIAGPAWTYWRRGIFPVAALAVLLSLSAALLTPAAERLPERVPPPSHINPAYVWVFMLIAWLGMFGSGFARGTVTTMMPRLGDDLGYSPILVGKLLFVMAGAQAIAFLLARLTTRWQYHLWPLVATTALGLGAALLAAGSRQSWQFAVSFVVLGGGLGLTFVSGITYALQAGAEGRGRRTGMHEAIMGAGLVAGPLVGGLAAQYLDLRQAPFQAVAAVLALALIGQGLVWLRMRKTLTVSQAGDSTAAMPPPDSL